MVDELTNLFVEIVHFDCNVIELHMPLQFTRLPG